MEWTLNHSLSTPGKSIAYSTTNTAGAELKIVDEPLPTNSTNLLIAGALRAAGIKALYIVSTVAATLKTNSTGSPDNTFTLVANKPVIWDTGYPSSYACPITVDVTKFYATNTTAGTITILALYDPTV